MHACCCCLQVEHLTLIDALCEFFDNSVRAMKPDAECAISLMVDRLQQQDAELTFEDNGVSARLAACHLNACRLLCLSCSSTLHRCALASCSMYPSGRLCRRCGPPHHPMHTTAPTAYAEASPDTHHACSPPPRSAACTRTRRTTT